jgi:2-enoate reductase
MMKNFGSGALPGENFREFGRNMKESEKAVRYLQDAGYDMLNADNGTYDSWYWSHPPMYMPQNCNLEDVAHIKKFVDIPVVCAGRMDPETGAQAVAEGLIDAVGVARQFLADPEWVTKLLRNRVNEIRPCICCHAGCFNFAHHSGHANDQTFSDTQGLARCALNPETMQSKKYKLIPAKRSKRVHIVGGGIGGMEAALVCAKRGHRVTLYEKSNRLGGAFHAAAAPSFKEKDRQLLKWYEQEIAKYPINVKLNWRIEENDFLMGEEIIVATGAKPNLPKIKGVELGIEATEFLLGKKKVGENVVIIGGGLTGCEIAYELYLQGKKPTIVEIKEDIIAVPGVCMANSSYLRDFFTTNQVPVHLQTSVKEIHPDGVTVTDKDGRFLKISADSVILCTGYKSAPVIPGAKQRVHLVGDCSKVGNLRSVIWQAWDVAMKI